MIDRVGTLNTSSMLLAQYSQIQNRSLQTQLQISTGKVGSQYADVKDQASVLAAAKTKASHITPELLKKSEEMVRFYIYDGYDFGTAMDACNKYAYRKAWIDENLPKYSKYYRKVDTTLVHSQKELDEMYNKFLADGEEKKWHHFV